MVYKSLQGKMDAIGNAAEFLRNVSVGAYQYPVQSQFKNCRDEQRSWRETVGLLDQSLRMTDLYVEGPDTMRLLSHVGVKSFQGSGRNKGKQLICCSPSGHVIGDMVLFGLEDDKVNIVGRPTVTNWIRYVIDSGDFDVTYELDHEADFEFGKEMAVIWGEPDRGTSKPGVERHFQKEIRATIQPWPYTKQAQSYRP